MVKFSIYLNRCVFVMAGGIIKQGLIGRVCICTWFISQIMTEHHKNMPI